MRGRLLSRGSWCLLYLVAATACTQNAQPSSPEEPTPTQRQTIVVTPEPLASGVRLSFVQQRIDEGTRRSQVRVVNGDPEPVRVRAVGIDWLGYPLRLHRVDYDVYGQQTVDLRYLLPPAVCVPAAQDAPIEAVVVTDTGRLTRPVEDDGVRFLTRLWQTECDTRRLDAAVHLTYSGPWRVIGAGATARLRGRLVLTRPPRSPDDRAVDVTQVEGSVLFDLEVSGATGLPAGSRRTTVPLAVRSGGRCDPHSRGQSTQTFLFRAFLSLDGGPEIARLIRPDAALQRRLLRFLDQACAGIS